MKAKLLLLTIGGIMGIVISLTYLIFFSPTTLSNNHALGLQSVSIDDIFCQVDDFTQADSQIEVPVKVQAGKNTNQIPPPVVAVDDVQASVVHEQGDENESQTYLRLTLRHGTSAVSSVLYDYIPEWMPGPVNVIYFEEGDKTIRLQCSFSELE